MLVSRMAIHSAEKYPPEFSCVAGFEKAEHRGSLSSQLEKASTKSWAPGRCFFRHMNSIKRRTFLKSGLAASALGFRRLAKCRVQRPRAGGADRLRRPGHAGHRELGQRSDVKCTQICDIHEDRLVRIADHMAEQQGGRKPLLAGMEPVYANKDVDAVVVATPDHWRRRPPSSPVRRARMSTSAVQPQHLGGRKLARRHRVLAHRAGWHAESSAPYTLAARDYSRKTGDVRLVKVFNLKGGGPFHLGQSGESTEGFSWKTWLGPATRRIIAVFSTLAGTILGLLRRRPGR